MSNWEKTKFIPLADKAVAWSTHLSTLIYSACEQDSAGNCFPFCRRWWKLMEIIRSWMMTSFCSTWFPTCPLSVGWICFQEETFTTAEQFLEVLVHQVKPFKGFNFTLHPVHWGLQIRSFMSFQNPDWKPGLIELFSTGSQTVEWAPVPDQTGPHSGNF